jgi:hypothetical protein
MRKAQLQPKRSYDRELSGGVLIGVIRQRRVFPRALMTVLNHRQERRPSACREEHAWIWDEDWDY